ncbi:Fe(3+)-hydroxamate ABC transporter permease FhuB [Paracoccus onubensis]|uniref:Fe(3+)-hydroxamate ABC transporter permease FhuB n=1 Tax=Paracoccus onubensis TaxID=1675788 RepID=A0A418SY27_9RHOB|nr:Fe(3+)-hydroxamate ABC transporter permease FhuB [Paracoccus onubensis]RJE85864.1 Fe(3+)-hydroxamate ABC transporter permease FhuB [Paracoccus onubensis]
MQADSADLPSSGLALPGAIALSLFAAVAALAWITLARLLPPADWALLLSPAGLEDPQLLLARDSHLPRIAVSLLTGAGLALAGVIFQNVLRNPLAEPTTLGVSAGAQLALVAATLWDPGIARHAGSEGIAFLGAVAAMLLVLLIGHSRTQSPTRMIVAGIFVSLYAGAVSGVLVLFNSHYLTGVFLWSSGSLIQNGWENALGLAWRMALFGIAAAALVRPLGILSLGDESARALGINVPLARTAALVLAVGLTASTVSMAGMIAFIGLAAPAIARSAGARGVAAQLCIAPLIGAGLLGVTDQLVQLLPLPREIPTGAAAALIGAPLLLWLLPRLSPSSVAASQPVGNPTRIARPLMPLILAGIALAGLVWMALTLGRGPSGWLWLGGTELAQMLHWRWPRVLAAGMAGAMLAAAGAVIQRITLNPLASPEILGISSGAALGLIVALFLSPAPSPQLQFLATAAGAGLTMTVILSMVRRGVGPDRLLLVGIAAGTMFSALAAVLMASGDPRMGRMLGWMAGSTYGVSGSGAVMTAIIGCLVLAALPLALRPLGILPLGDGVAHSVGIPVARMRLWLLMLTACATAAATLTVGPLSFVGLMAPHLARLIGFQRPGSHLAASVLAGSAIMIAADWLGRSVIFPYQIPAGLFASFLAGPFFLVLLRRQR